MPILRLPAASVAGTAVLCFSAGAQAVTWQAGDWELGFSGNVNAFYVYTKCEDEPKAVAGGLTCNAGNGDDAVSSVNNGLLPAALVFSAKTNQSGYDLSANIGFYPGTNTNDTPGAGVSPNFGGANVALGTAAIDVRQVYLTFGNKDMGTVLIGRNFGLFGFDAIINDMSIPGVGVQGFTVPNPNNTTLGGIGFGYIYTDTLTQFNWSSPDWSGFTLTVGIFSPLDTLSLSGTGAGSSASLKDTPGFHGKVRYDFSGGALSGFVSASAIYQQHKGVTGTVHDEFTGSAADIVVKLVFGNAELVGSLYAGEGIGTTGLFFDAVDAEGSERDSSGGYLQAGYTIDKTKLGIKYGVSKLDRTSADPLTLVETNQALTLGVYHKLTPNLQLIGEWSTATSENHAGDENENWNINVGAFLAF